MDSSNGSPIKPQFVRVILRIFNYSDLTEYCYDLEIKMERVGDVLCMYLISTGNFVVAKPVIGN